MLGERVVASFPAVQALLTQETLYIVGTVRARVVPETGFGELSQCQQIIRSPRRKNKASGTRTLAGVICLCGQLRALEPPRPLAAEPRFFVVFLKVARRPSYVKRVSRSYEAIFGTMALLLKELECSWGEVMAVRLGDATGPG